MAEIVEEAPTFDIPKECIAGVVVDEGPDFRVEVQKVPVPEIGTVHESTMQGTRTDTNNEFRP